MILYIWVIRMGRNSYASIKRYEDKNYDKILVRIPKGDREIFKAHAASRGESLNGFIGRSLSETMLRDRLAQLGAGAEPQ